MFVYYILEINALRIYYNVTIFFTFWVSENAMKLHDFCHAVSILFLSSGPQPTPSSWPPLVRCRPFIKVVCGFAGQTLKTVKMNHSCLKEAYYVTSGYS